jgi:hypothetical protein
MGYDVHITRKKDRLDDHDLNIIHLEEWKMLVANDPDMRLDNHAEAATFDGVLLRVESEGLSVWTKYSGDKLRGNRAWFDYGNGEITVKNPDQEIIYKMIEIAILLKARVEGDDGEIYERSDDNLIPNHRVTANLNQKDSGKKSWWKFW